MKPRAKCSYCFKKRYTHKMYEVFYPLLHKTAWHCIECYKKIEAAPYDFHNNVTLLAAQKAAEEENDKMQCEAFQVNEII